MKFDKFSKGKEELLDHWIRPSFNLMSRLRPKHLFWFSNLRMKSQKLINWMIYMKSHLSDFTTDHNQQFQIKVRVTETWKYIAKTGQNFNKYIHTQDNLLHILYSLILVSMFTLSYSFFDGCIVKKKNQKCSYRLHDFVDFTEYSWKYPSAIWHLSICFP